MVGSKCVIRASGSNAELRSGGRQTTQQQRRGSDLLQGVNYGHPHFLPLFSDFHSVRRLVHGANSLFLTTGVLISRRRQTRSANTDLRVSSDCSAADPGRVQEELDMGRIHTAAAGLAIAAAAAMYIGAAPAAHADPPICGSPDRPCAGPSPLTPEQQCAFTAWRTMMPCNWLGQQVPQGTPGSWG
jgi:hypothetical protein